jgi:thiol-disulfide isomerase/thioredoxin
VLQVWCGPCHAIAPVLEQLSNKVSCAMLLIGKSSLIQFTQVKFVKIDVDKQAQLAQRFQVRAMPTFKFLKGGKEVAEVRPISPERWWLFVADWYS